jgi:pilus assembly protein CpaF
VVIRRHRLMQVTLEDLVRREMLTPIAASFLRAAVRTRKSIVVAGAQGAGKTTLVRALCGEIDEMEAIGTFETEYELQLHELDRHQIVHAWESRPGSGERGPDGRQAGEFTLDEALVDSFRFNLSRQIVGEVRGKEIWAMIKAMESGTGSISTTHAADAVAAVRKLVTCAMEAGPHITQGLATSKLAATVDLIVQLGMETVLVPGGARRTRRVLEIIALAPGEKDPGYATTHVFSPDASGVAVPDVLPDEYRALARHGFDLAGYLSTQPLGGTP